MLILLGHIFDDRLQRCSRGKVGTDISTNRQIRKMRFSTRDPLRLGLTPLQGCRWG
jgi:hypothetical protein